MLIWIVNEKTKLRQFYHSMYRFTFKIIIIVNNIRFAVNHSFFIRSYEEHMNTRGKKFVILFSWNEYFEENILFGHCIMFPHHKLCCCCCCCWCFFLNKFKIGRMVENQHLEIGMFKMVCWIVALFFSWHI